MQNDIDENIMVSKSKKKISWVGPNNAGLRYTVMELHECLDTISDDAKISEVLEENSVRLINGFVLHYTMLDRLYGGKIEDKNIRIEV